MNFQKLHNKSWLHKQRRNYHIDVHSLCWFVSWLTFLGKFIICADIITCHIKSKYITAFKNHLTVFNNQLFVYFHNRKKSCVFVLFFVSVLFPQCWFCGSSSTNKLFGGKNTHIFSFIHSFDGKSFCSLMYLEPLFQLRVVVNRIYIFFPSSKWSTHFKRHNKCITPQAKSFIAFAKSLTIHHLQRKINVRPSAVLDAIYFHIKLTFGTATCVYHH